MWYFVTCSFVMLPIFFDGSTLRDAVLVMTSRVVVIMQGCTGGGIEVHNFKFPPLHSP